MSNQWRDVLDTLAALGRAVLAERADEDTRPGVTVSQANTPSRASAAVPRGKARGKVTPK